MCGMNQIRNLFRAIGLVCVLALAATSTRARPNDVGLDVAKQLNNAFIEVAEKVSPAVVVIQVWHKPNYFEEEEEENPLFDMLPRQFRKQFEEQRERQRQSRAKPPSQRQPDGQGSGIILREEGYILTNRHVVDGAEKVRVRLKNGKLYNAEIKGADPLSDIAIIKIDAKNLNAAKLADCLSVAGWKTF